MDTLSETIWQRGSTVEIMREARGRFRANSKKDLPGAYVSLASVHYSLVKRYATWWKSPFALWHLWRAAWNIDVAFEVGGRNGDMTKFSPDQVDVISTILAKVPSWLGGDRVCATSLLNSALYLNHPWGSREMKPHTRALMLITLGEIEWQVGSKEQARKHYDEARYLAPVIEVEVSADRERQLVRVLSAVGFFYYDHGGQQYRYQAKTLLEQALDLARSVSKDQEEKIIAEWRKRGF